MTFTLSAYRNAKDTKGVNVSLTAVEKRIRTGDRGLDDKTKMCHVLASTDKEAYREYKAKELPAVTFAGTFPKGKRLAEHLSAHSSLVVLDIDNLSETDTPLFFGELSQLQQVTLAFISPSGRGIKLIVSVNPVPMDAAEHKAAWKACVDHFEGLADEYGFDIDPSGSDVNRLCYLAHDPQAITRTETLPIDWDREAYLSAEEERQKRKVELEGKDWSGEKDLSALDFIPRDLPYEQWRNIGMAIKDAGFPMSVFEQWSGGQRLNSSGVWITEDIAAHWGRYRGTGITWGTIVYHAEQNGYKLPTGKRYKVDSDYQHKTSDLETEQDANQNVLTQWLQDTEQKQGRHLLILGSAAGTGKTTVAVTSAAQLLYISKTVEEADQVFQTLWDAEDDVVRHRPRLYNRDHEQWNTLPLGLTEKDRPCIQPELCNLYAARGHATLSVCQRCPLKSDCELDGYLSQEVIEQTAKKVIYAWDETVACDRIHTARVKRICSKDDILIVDEVNPASLTQHRSVTRDMLYDLRERFRLPNTAEEFEILDALHGLISGGFEEQEFIDGLKTQLEQIDDIKALDKKLQKFPVGYVFSEVEGKSYRFQAVMNYQGKEVTVPVTSEQTAVDTPVFEVGAETPITPDTWQVSFLPLSVLLKVGLVDLADPPRRYHSFFTDIKTFIEEHPKLETAPFSYDPKKQTFDFHLKPILNHKRVIFNTASDPDNLISEAYRDANIQITRHTGETPSWKNPLVFQLSTGNYLPRHSLIYREGEALALKPRAQEMIDRFIVPSIEAGLKTLVVAPKAFQEIEAVRSLQCDLINHHHAEGRNDYQDHDIVFVFHYEPDHSSVQEIATRLYRNAEQPLDFSREKRTVRIGGVSFEKNVYTDDRVQAVYNRECRERLMQSGMRLRPNIHEGKIVVYLTAEPVDIPVTPVSLTLAGGKDFAGDWQQLAKSEDATMQELVDDGVSERTAYRKTQDARSQTKAERDIEIVRRFHKQQSKKQIATSMGISQDTVKRVLDKQAF